MVMEIFRLNIADFDELQEALKNYQGNAEEIINDVLHNEAGPMIETEINRLMPVSGKNWKGKKKAAKHSKSLMLVKENLAITVKTTNAYHYLYFPDDGSTTKRHAGNQQFFKRGGDRKKSEIVDRCISRLVDGV